MTYTCLKAIWCIYPRHIHNIMSVCITRLYTNIPIHKILTHTDQSQHPKICTILFYDYYKSSYYKIPDSGYYGDWPVPGNCLAWLPWDSRDPPCPPVRHYTCQTSLDRQAESVWHLADSRPCHTAGLPIGLLCCAFSHTWVQFTHTTLLLLSLWLTVPPVMCYSTTCRIVLPGAVAAIITTCVPAAGSASGEHITRVNINALQPSALYDSNKRGRWHALCMRCKWRVRPHQLDIA